MSSYSGIAPYYDRIFPYDEMEKAFLRTGVYVNGQTRLAGCRLRHGYLFSRSFRSISSFFLAWISMPSLSKQRMKNCRRTKRENVELYEADMREISRLFPGYSFSAVSCLGNTIPHLCGLDENSGFF